MLRATKRDAIHAREAIAEVHGRAELDQGALREFLSDPARYLLLALEKDRVVGSLNGHALRHPHRREPQFLLYEVDVRPEFRKLGVATALIRGFIQEAPKRRGLRGLGAYQPVQPGCDVLVRTLWAASRKF